MQGQTDGLEKQQCEFPLEGTTVGIDTRSGERSLHELANFFFIFQVPRPAMMAPTFRVVFLPQFLRHVSVLLWNHFPRHTGGSPIQVGD